MNELNLNTFKALLRLTLANPRAAAQQIMALNIPRQSLWISLALMSVLNGIVYSVSIRLSPPAESAAAFVPPAFHSPFLFTIFLFAGLVATVIVLHRLGASMGGKAGLGDILILITWLQVLRLLVQLILTALIPIAPGMVGLLAIIVAIWGVYILICFIDEAHRFQSFGKAAGAMILTSLAIAIGLTIIMLVVGSVFMGIR